MFLLVLASSPSTSNKLTLAVILCIHLFGGVGLFCDLSSLRDLRKVIDFQFIQLLPYYKDRSDDLQAFGAITNVQGGFLKYKPVLSPFLSPPVQSCVIMQLIKLIFKLIFQGFA